MLSCQHCPQGDSQSGGFRVGVSPRLPELWLTHSQPWASHLCGALSLRVASCALLLGCKASAWCPLVQGVSQGPEAELLGVQLSAAPLVVDSSWAAARGCVAAGTGVLRCLPGYVPSPRQSCTSLPHSRPISALCVTVAQCKTGPSPKSGVLAGMCGCQAPPHPCLS